MKACLNMKRALLFLISCLCLAKEVMGSSRNYSAASSIRPKVVNIGALFTFNSIIGRSAGPALTAAIRDVNSDSSILNGTKLNLILQDTNCSGFIGTVEGIENLHLCSFLEFVLSFLLISTKETDNVCCLLLLWRMLDLVPINKNGNFFWQ